MIGGQLLGWKTALCCGLHTLQAPSWQNVFSKLTLMDRNGQVRFFKCGFDILRFDIFFLLQPVFCVFAPHIKSEFVAKTRKNASKTNHNVGIIKQAVLSSHISQKKIKLRLTYIWTNRGRKVCISWKVIVVPKNI